MNRALGFALLVAVTCVALWLRFEVGASGRPTDEEARAQGVGWYVTDARTALHLRRIELALASGSVPRADRYLDHPSLGEVDELPLFDTLLAAGAQRALAGTGDDAALRGVDEAALEHWMAAVSLWLAIATVLATYWTARAFAGTWPALAAAAVVAVFPPAVAAAAVGELDAHVFAAAVLALGAGCLARSLRADEPLDAVATALLAGGMWGLASAASFSGLIAFLVAWSACALACFRGAAPVRAARARAGLCFCIVAALSNQMFLGDTADWGTGRVLAAAAHAGSFVFVIGALPFLAAALWRGERKRRTLHMLVLVGGALVLLYGARDTLRDLQQLGDVLLAKNAEAPSIAAIALALSAALWLEKRRSLLPWNVVGVAVIALGVSARSLAESGSDRVGRAEIVRGLRWLRDHSPAAGAWNSAVGTTDYGVLADPSLGTLVAYHARRPAVCSDVLAGDGNAARVLAALKGTDAAALLRELHVLEAEYVVVSPASVTTRDDSLELRLSLDSKRDPACAELGLVPVYVSPLPSATSSSAGPALAIYRVTRKPAADGGARSGGFAPR